MSKKESCAVKKTSIGGQALIEGIMMRGPKKSAMAVRDTDGKIVLEKWDTKVSTKSKFFKLPIIRGVFNFIDSMASGYKCLMRSAEISGLEELEEQARLEKEAKKAAKAAAKAKKKGKELPTDAVVASAESAEEAKAEQSEKAKKKEGSALTAGIMVVAVVLAVVLSVGLFMWLPNFLYELLAKDNIAPFLHHENEFLDSLIKSAFEGILKIIIIVGYMSLMLLMKDIRRTFQYHGAEHKTIFCYEHGKELTVENVRKERRFHPRCGTSFLILMILVGILISFFIDPVANLIGAGEVSHIVRTLIKLLLFPLTMGIGYELIKLAGRHDNILTRIISAPGMWLQHVTVLEPTDDMIECAIMAFKEVIPEEEKTDNEPTPAAEGDGVK